jgi:hypothetical protein
MHIKPWQELTGKNEPQITGKKMYIYEKGQVFVFLFKKY